MRNEAWADMKKRAIAPYSSMLRLSRKATKPFVQVIADLGGLKFSWKNGYYGRCVRWLSTIQDCLNNSYSIARSSFGWANSRKPWAEKSIKPKSIIKGFFFSWRWNLGRELSSGHTVELLTSGRSAVLVGRKWYLYQSQLLRLALCFYLRRYFQIQTETRVVASRSA